MAFGYFFFNWCYCVICFDFFLRDSWDSLKLCPTHNLLTVNTLLSNEGLIGTPRGPLLSSSLQPLTLVTLPTHWYLSYASPLRLLCSMFPWSRLPHILFGVRLVCHLTLDSSAQHWIKQALRRQSQVYCPTSFLSSTRIQTLQRAKFPEYIYTFFFSFVK